MIFFDLPKEESVDELLKYNEKVKQIAKSPSKINETNTSNKYKNIN